MEDTVYDHREASTAPRDFPLDLGGVVDDVIGHDCAATPARCDTRLAVRRAKGCEHFS